ncbi:MAG: carboxy-S-adenosyl-L-methionine synthase CmoA [SAR86 cluster bacterium]|uniref:Carboxy-S-adenosyl-L-methionine synthase n=1 Tax=SAR86 cluster bacterium TaxID=2030880 RepID=A0A2A4X1Q0_9GAMM|nr:MAG: carboxy-S-adenosyl-L-methionine synthase CmoA [SAR86 cluster bacterium]
MTEPTQNKDRIFAETKLPGDFVFDEKVASVFEDMINRSIPGYSTIIAMIGVLAEEYCQEQSRIYDLGCSLGGATLAAADRVKCQDFSTIAIDNSAAMIDRLQTKLKSMPRLASKIECRCENLCDSEITDASVVVLNFTLQFIPLAERASLLSKIYAGMKPGGVLIISEKITFPDEKLNQLFIEMYHSFKENMGYSKLEISQKRAALEKVLLPETLDVHRDRLQKIGFQSVDVWFQCFNFASMVAFK